MTTRHQENRDEMEGIREQIALVAAGFPNGDLKGHREYHVGLGTWLPAGYGGSQDRRAILGMDEPRHLASTFLRLPIPVIGRHDHPAMLNRAAPEGFLRVEDSVHASVADRGASVPDWSVAPE